MGGQRTFGLTVALALGVSQAWAADRSGERVAALCAACHRLDRGPNAISPLVSLGADQIVAMMKGFRARPQSSHIMNTVSRSLSDAEIVAVAAYLSGLAKKGEP